MIKILIFIHVYAYFDKITNLISFHDDDLCPNFQSMRNIQYNNIIIIVNVFFYTFQSWVAAFTETFLTWGILGACTMQITSHNRPKHLLHRDASLVVILTLAVLILAAFLANTCVQLLEAHGYVYLPSSFGESFSISLF